jgi:hypothetical protein
LPTGWWRVAGEHGNELRLFTDVGSEERAHGRQSSIALVGRRQPLIARHTPTMWIRRAALDEEIPVIHGTWRKDLRRPDRVVEVVVRPHHEHRVFGRGVSRHVVARIVEEVDALQVGDVAVAIWQQHGKRDVVDYGTAEVDRGERKDRADTVGRWLRLVVQEVPHDTFASARVPHRTDPGQVNFADELHTKRQAPGGVERIPQIQVVLDQLGARQCAEIEYQVVARIDAIRAD